MKKSIKNLLCLMLSTCIWQMIAGQGVGIGIANPNAPLQFSNSVQNRKIVLYETSNNDHMYFGFGINGAMLRYQTDLSHSDHVFFSGVNDSTSTELMRIKGNGNVGIKIHPTNLLDIGSDRTGTHPINRSLYVTKLTFSESESIAEFRHSTGAQGIGFGWNTISAVGTNTNQQLAFASKGAAPLIFRTEGSEKMRIAPNGHVGIGTNPTNLLDVGINRTGTHASGRAMYVTGYVEDFYEPIMEIRNDVGTRGIGFGFNAIFPSGTDADQPLLLAAKGTSALLFETNGTEKMRIAATGYVGIGMANQNIQNWVDINGFSGARTGTHATSQTLYVTGNFGAASNGVQFRHKDGTQGIGFGFNTIYAAGSSTHQDLGFEAKGTAGLLRFTTNGSERVRINGAGKVGIGTTAPNGALQFGQTLENRKIVLWEAANNDHAYFGFGVNSDGTLRYQTANVVNDHVFYAAVSSSASNEVMRIKGTGNVGIGTSSPTAPLQFSNTVQSRKIVLGEVANNIHQFAGFGIGGDLSMRYQTPQEWTEHIFYSGAGPSLSIELMRIGNIDGLVVNVGTTMGHVTVNETLTLEGDMVVNGNIVTENFIVPTLLNGFTQYGNGHANAAYYKDEMGRVCLRGLVQNANNPANLVIFNLPAGYRPSTSGKLLFPVISNNALGRVDILTNGDVVVIFGSATWLSLDGITFKAD